MERILASRGALTGERKHVTILFADIKGSTEIIADLDPEDARKILDPVLELMMDAVHEYEGFVNQVSGDGIMALFGAPLAQEGHAVRACFAALRMQETVDRHGTHIHKALGVPIRIRVGLNSGQVLVRSIGSDLQLDFSAIGRTTNVAARMEQIAEPGSVLITEDTRRLLEGYAQVTSRGPVKVKGLATPVEAYEVTGALSVRSRFRAMTARGLSKFVGRTDLLARLGESCEQAGNGYGQVVALVGEPGVGKSRLLWEFMRLDHLKGWLVLEGASISYSRATSYMPVIDLLRRYFGIEGRDTGPQIREKVTGKLRTLDPALAPMLPALFGLLDVPVADRGWSRLDPRQQRQGTHEAVIRLLLRESQRQPIALVVEDIQWLDSESQAVLGSLVGRLATARLLLLVNYRPEYEHGWADHGRCVQIHVDPLGLKSTGELLDALLGLDQEVQSLKPMLVVRTGGNPLFLEESIRGLVESGVLAGESGAYRLVNSAMPVDVPATVQEILAARIDRLPYAQKRLLQSASVIGKEVPLALLKAMGHRATEGIRRGLEALMAQDFLFETASFPDRVLAFKHALTHEVAYSTLLLEQRRALHRRLVAVIERVHADRLPEHIERLAHHAVRGELWEQAVSFLRRAAAEAAARAAASNAVSFCEEALAALTRLPDNDETRAQGIDVRFELFAALTPLGQFDRMRDVLHSAEAQVTALNDKRRLGRVSAHLTQCFFWMGEPDRAIETGERARRVASGLGDLSLAVATNFRLGQAYFAVGKYRRASEIFQENIERLGNDMGTASFSMPILPSVSGRVYRGWCFARLGNLAAVNDLAAEAIQIATAAGHRLSRVWGDWVAGLAKFVQGDFASAIRLLEPSLTVCRVEGLPAPFSRVAGLLGHAYALSGRFTEGIALLEEAAASSASIHYIFNRVRAVASLGETYLISGRRPEAHNSLRAALEFSRTHKQRWIEPDILRALAGFYASADPPAAELSAANYREALALATELEMRPTIADCHLGLGELFGRTDRYREARENLTRAVVAYGDMDMPFWLAKAQTELRRLP